MTQVILGKSRVREICMPGSVRAKAEWLSYSTIPDMVRKTRYFIYDSWCQTEFTPSNPLSLNEITGSNSGTSNASKHRLTSKCFRN